MADMKWEGPLKDIDPLTWQTIVEIQLEDSKEMTATSNGKGKQRAGTQTDAQLAMQVYVNDLQHSSTYLQDRKMAQSVAMAILQDGALISETFRQEQQAVTDRQIAMRLDARRPQRQGVTAPPAAVAGRAPPSNHSQGGPAKKQKKDHKDPWQDDEVLEKVTAMYMKAPEKPVPDASPDDDTDVVIGESSAWAAARETSTRPMRTCLACDEEKDFFDVIRVPCNHEYCRDCLESLFSACLRDETLFPPRCDNQEISLEWVRLWISADLAKEFEAKYEELSTKNRTYCHEHTCMTFISESSYNGLVATCSKCSRTTCNNCKKPSHTGDCAEDEALRQLVETADAQQWQRCYKCLAMVELEQGCYHMSCRCGAEFCYTCGARWKTCECRQWDEDRLVRRATQLVDRHPNRRLYRPPQVAHAQPVTRPPAPDTGPSGTVAAGSSAGKRRRDSDGTNINPAIVHDDDDSDASEWEPDWWLHDVVHPAQNATGPIHERGARIAHAVEHLRANHACAHEQWRHRRGGFDCEECGIFCNRFVLECRQCSIQVCVQCRRNRL